MKFLEKYVVFLAKGLEWIEFKEGDLNGSTYC